MCDKKINAVLSITRTKVLIGNGLFLDYVNHYEDVNAILINYVEL